MNVKKYMLKDTMGMYLKNIKGSSTTFQGMLGCYTYTEDKEEAMKLTYNDAVELKHSNRLLLNTTVTNK